MLNLTINHHYSLLQADIEIMTTRHYEIDQNVII